MKYFKKKSYLIFKSIKALEIKTSRVFNLDFANNFNFLSCFFFFFLITGLYFLNPADIAQTFNPTAELVIAIGIPNIEAKAKIETHTVTT